MNSTEIMLRAEIRVLERVIADRGYQKPPVMPSQRTPEFLALRRKICGGSCFTEIDMLNDGGVTEASVICGPCDIKTMEQLNPKANLEDVMNYRVVSKEYPAFRVGYDPVPDWAQREIDRKLIFLNVTNNPETWALFAFDGQWIVDDRQENLLCSLYTDEQFRERFEPIPRTVNIVQSAIEANVLTDRQKAACDVARASLDRFNRCAGGMVSKDYAEGYREACQHIIDRLSE